MKLLTKLLLTIALLWTISSCENQPWTSDDNKTPKTNAVSENKVTPTDTNEVSKVEEEKPAKLEAEKITNDKASDSSITMNKEAKLAECLKEKWAKIFWTEWCSHCKRQKSMFWKEAMKILWFTDCDKERQVCIDHWIKWYPTWIINWENLPGVRELNFLASKTWCIY